jgi:hypothetical protein
MQLDFSLSSPGYDAARTPSKLTWVTFSHGQGCIVILLWQLVVDPDAQDW